MKFGLAECNAIVIPLVVNEKTYKNDNFGPVDGHIYRGIISSLMYLTTTHPNITLQLGFSLGSCNSRVRITMGQLEEFSGTCRVVRTVEFCMKLARILTWWVIMIVTRRDV